jgi:hypothetical protein
MLFLPNLSSSVGVQKVQLRIQDLLVDLSRFRTTIIRDPAVHRRRDQRCSGQDASGSQQPVESTIISPEGTIQQGALRAFISEDLYHLQYGKSLLRFFPSVGRQRQWLSAELFSQSLESRVSFA